MLAKSTKSCKIGLKNKGFLGFRGKQPAWSERKRQLFGCYTEG